MAKKMIDTFYFYVNFPRSSEKQILIHRNIRSHCNDRKGKIETGSNEKGFWAGPFTKYDHASKASKY
jgi:broad specificity polyphosphatase/5'/3'-nucleotidase SurE